MNVEFELKYRATPQTLSALRQHFSGEEQILSMETVYYDTPDGDFAARKLTLRRRMENGQPVCTLKTPAAGLARGEYELVCEGIEDAVLELCKLAGLPALAQAAEKGLIPICGARFTRVAKLLTLPQCSAELALDTGVLTGGGREVPLCEAELELKSGSQEALCAYADTLAAAFSLIPETKSKFRRALALAKGD